MGRDLGHMKTYGSDSVNTIEAEVKQIMDACYAEAKRILIEKIDVLHKGAALLIEREKIGQKEFEEIYYGKAEDENSSEEEVTSKTEGEEPEETTATSSDTESEASVEAKETSSEA